MPALVVKYDDIKGKVPAKLTDRVLQGLSIYKRFHYVHGWSENQ